MYAVIKTGGKQYKVAQGDKLRSRSSRQRRRHRDLRSGAPRRRRRPEIGTPLVAGAKVEAKVIAQDRTKKIIVFKFRRRKNYRRKNGHRQPFTALEITGIKA